ncbi:MAG TPA: acyl-CoA dehydrogenase family protein [Candidatus Nanopelagicales bacterium]|jgi:alkylation response protein AidB-like acyl-CoA dehydrogenase
MYPLLRLDEERCAWIDRVSADIADLAEVSRAELETANKENRFPREVFAELGRRGYCAPMTPTEWGGSGGGVREYVVINEETGRHGMVTPQVSVQGQRWLLDWGTEEQKQRWLPGIAAGALIFSESISETGAGSSFKQMKATAVRDGSDWILNGSKCHVNMGADCDVTLFYANAEEGLTSFLVDTDLPGVHSEVSDAIGSRLIRTADVHLDDVRVRGEDLLGPPGAGVQTFLSTFNVSRLGNASELIGFGRRMLELAVNYASARQVGDNLVTDFQGIQWMLADAWTGLQSASLARDHAAELYDRGADIALQTTTAKQLAVVASENASKAAFSMTGGHSLYHDQPFLAIDNEIKVLKVAGGSSEVMRNFIARRILKDPGHEGLT